MQFEDRLRCAMREHNLRNNSLARASGLHPSTVSGFLTGRHQPNFPAMQALLKALPYIGARWLISGDQ